jgi:hypothetical protein
MCTMKENVPNYSHRISRPRNQKVLRTGLEPMTSSVLTMCDNQLHHPSGESEFLSNSDEVVNLGQYSPMYSVILSRFAIFFTGN